MPFSKELARLQGALLLYGERVNLVNKDGIRYRTEYYFPLPEDRGNPREPKKSIDKKAKT